jgi:hypothetical protein
MLVFHGNSWPVWAAVSTSCLVSLGIIATRFFGSCITMSTSSSATKDVTQPRVEKMLSSCLTSEKLCARTEPPAGPTRHPDEPMTASATFLFSTRSKTSEMVALRFSPRPSSMGGMSSGFLTW